MLLNAFDVQHAALACQHNNASRLAATASGFKHKRCPVVQARTPPKLSKVLATQHTSGDEASSSSRSTSSSSPFFGRKLELEHLKQRFESSSNSISVVLGPLNAGKTALLQEYLRERGLTDSRCLIDARVAPITSPNDLAQALLKSAVPSFDQLFADAQALQDAVETFLAVIGGPHDTVKLGDGSELTFSGDALAPILQAYKWGTGEAPPLKLVTKGYIAVLDAWDKARAAGQLKDPRPPLLVIDEANVLMTWGDQYKTDRQTLLRFFIAISKQQNRSHVLLATSDYSFYTWLSKEIGAGFFNSFVIGDFPEEEARQFLNQRLQQSGASGVSDADWEAVYKVCGGNAGTLITAAEARPFCAGWEEALSLVTKDVWSLMRPGYRPAPDAAYTAADYATAVDAILKSPYRAVVDDDITALIGEESLEAMVQANQLALRPYSSWARDIDVAAFGPEQDATVVTAPTAVHLYHMGRKRNRVLAALNTQQVPARRDPDRSSSPGQSRSSSPTSDDIRKVANEIAAVDDNIAVVDGEIQQVNADMLAIITAKEEGWREKLAILQQEKQYLVEEKKQLREDKKQLREKELWLMKRDE